MSTLRLCAPRRGGWLGAAARALFVLVLWAPVPAAVGAALVLTKLAREVPELPDVTVLKPAYGSSVRALDGRVVAGRHATGPVPLDDLPPLLLGAILAAEDEDFFTHRAFDARAIARAAFVNARSGKRAQGGSTITQQLAKQFMGRERSYTRKLQELLLARRMEATLGKRRVLELYVQGVFLGRTAHGVTQASWLYFGRDPRRLSLGQMATIAGILPAPSAFEPIGHPQAAERQRDRVLERMVSLGMITQADADAARDAPLEVARSAPPDDFPWMRTTGLRHLVEAYGERAWAHGGHTVTLAHDVAAQARARRALAGAARAYDRRQGWRGALAHLKDGAKDAVLKLLAEQDASARHVLGVVEDVTRERAVVSLGEHRVVLEEEAWSWAAPAGVPRHYKRPARLRDARRALSVGDVVLLERALGGTAPGDEVVTLAQPPWVEGAMVAIEPRSGRVLASVGGVLPARSMFHRAEQGCRQPGSAFKPIVYSEALGLGFTPATMLSDLPAEFMAGRDKVWTPRNADRDFRGYVMLADALASSRNIPTAHLMERLSPERVVGRAKRYGITTPLDAVPALGLGASCVRPVELAEAYAVYARGGRTIEAHLVDHVRDETGAVLEDHGAMSAPFATTAQRLDRALDAEMRSERALSVQLAFVMKRLLRRVVTRGTAHELPQAWPIIGKTGTTNEYDTWFVGMDDQVVVATWIGSDRNTRPISSGEHGATVAMPAFAQWYAPLGAPFEARADEAAEDVPKTWLDEEPPERVVLERVDPRSGLLSRSGVELPFLAGSEPVLNAPTRTTRRLEQIDQFFDEF
ncbi:MAG: transglycosylase domain-containing protein [Myxococcota bacterium]